MSHLVQKGFADLVLAGSFKHDGMKENLPVAPITGRAPIFVGDHDVVPRQPTAPVAAVVIVKEALQALLSPTGLWSHRKDFCTRKPPFLRLGNGKQSSFRQTPCGLTTKPVARVSSASVTHRSLDCVNGEGVR